jgi:hypothetical protein
MPVEVSIITRTANRPWFLSRVCDGLRAARPSDAEWIICDDAPRGTPGIGDFIEQAAHRLAMPVRLVESHSGSRPKAANRGLEAARGAFVHLHDDDDTIAPAFYARTTEFLKTESAYGGVAVLSERVDERWDGCRAVPHRRRPHYHEIAALTLASMATVQTIPPIALLVRRSTVETVGPFNVNLAVCEDHEFLLRLLMVADIGMIRECLAAFHQRVGGKDGDADALNSAASTEHATQDARFRNAMLRNDLAEGRVGLGFLLALGEMNQGAWRVNLLLSKLRQYTSFRFAERILRRSRSFGRI